MKQNSNKKDMAKHARKVWPQEIMEGINIWRYCQIVDV